MSQIKLNQKLYHECEQEIVDYHKIDSLLNKGANPLGTISSRDKYEYLYNRLVNDNKHLYELTKHFLAHGMVIDHSDYKQNPEDNIDPLWEFAFRCDAVGIKTLKLLLDNKLDHASAEEMVSHIFTDYIFLSGGLKKGEHNKSILEGYEYAMKMVLICASYEYIRENSNFIKEVAQCKDNNYDADRLRDYEKYGMKLSGDNKFTFYNKGGDKVIWVLDFNT